jgi:large subunit ribosomal protein L4
MRRLALVSALRDRFQADAVTVVERLPVEGDHPKTKPFAQMLEALGLAARKVLIVLPEADPVAYRSARNLPRVSVTTSGLLSAYDVMAHGDLLLTPESLHALEARLGASEAPGAAEAS